MPLPITSLYAAMLTLLYLLLCRRVILARRGQRVALGTGGNAVVERAMRAQANCAEYAPLGLLLLALLEGMGLPALALHGLGLTLLVGRAVHAWGISRTPEVFLWRVTGMGLTFTMLGGSALVLLAMVVVRWLD